VSIFLTCIIRAFFPLLTHDELVDLQRAAKLALQTRSNEVQVPVKDPESTDKP
jgi:hypothetical protein